MKFFHVIDEGQVVLRSKGLFRQSKVFRRGRDVYAGWGAGFIRLVTGGGTSKPDVSWLDIEADGVEHSPSKAPKFVGAIDEAAAS